MKLIHIALITSIMAPVSGLCDESYRFYTKDYINTEAEVMEVVYECNRRGKLTKSEYTKATTKHLWNVTLDEDNYCKQLKHKLKGIK